ncbi:MULTISPECIES: hypothetical protein [Paenibacillus]|uniref:hypothetical protein n=1 Tax=Paenibacillus TaxID=44249 RepID=UPI00096C64CC|nr:hypothetical protein [Paenibacillus odorifer]OME34972.1 hypothetical protein BSK58_25020 [Paenibacillus odorifer]
MTKDIEKELPLVAYEYRLLIEGYEEIKVNSRSAALTHEERFLHKLKLDTIERISLVLKLIEDSSERNKVLLVLCLNGEKCSKKYWSEGFKSQAALRAARNQLRFLLAVTLFRRDKIEALLKSESHQEVDDLRQWYNTIFGNNELKRYYLKPSKGVRIHES